MHTNKHEFVLRLVSISVHSRLVFGFGFAALRNRALHKVAFYL